MLSLFKKWNSCLRVIGFVFIECFLLLCNVEAQLPAGIILLPDGIRGLQNKKPATDSAAVFVNVTGKPFTDAIRINTFNPQGNASTTWSIRIANAVSKGDLLLLAFEARCMKSRRETGEAFIETRLDRFPNGKYEWPPLSERGTSVGAEWMSIKIPVIAARDVAAGDLAFVLRCGDMPQVVEIADLKLTNYQQTVKFEDLPRSVVRYDGDAPDAPWRKAAAARIDKYRKGDLTIKVVDKKGKPVPNARVQVQLRQPSFAWGAAINSANLLDTTNGDVRHYRDTLLKYFTKVVFDNEVKAKSWARTNHTRTIETAQWLHKNGIDIRGHVLVWPSWQHSPHLVQFKNDTAALRAAIINGIAEQTKTLKGQFTEWDVINEPYAHHDIIDLLGKDVMVDWFNAARRGEPDAKLFLNDYTMFQNISASEKFYENVKYLQSKGAPIQAIGEQGHIGGSPPGIDYVLARLDHFATLGLPIQISEFDIASDDDEFKMRYMKDFMTAVFSHPATIGFMQWGFWAGSHWMPSAALWDKTWQLRAHGKMFVDMLKNEWSTNVNGITGKDGSFVVRGFQGNYEIKLMNGGKEIVKRVTLTGKGNMVNISLVN